MPFIDPTITFGSAGLEGESSNNPTAIDYSKTGNPVLFVAQQDGNIYRYEIERQPDGPDGDSTDQIVVTSTLLLDDIQQLTQNYNDDGTVNNTTIRQVTGMVVTKDASGNDVLYVSSSDWRIAVGEDSGLDTNSGQIHKIVLDADTGAVLSNVAIVRGLPRSEENHSNNGLDLSVDPVTGDTYLWVASGGNTNKGAPGNNFAGTVEFALAAAVLKINLTELESYDVRTDGNGDEFILDLPTLDDPTRTNVDLGTQNIDNLAADPNFTLDDNGSNGGVLNPDWAGGNNGLNQAKITDFVLVSEAGQLKLVANPLAVHAPGFRNAYDVLVTEAGEVFTWDNGPNSGWGGQPVSYSDGQIVDDWTTELATNEFNEGGSSQFGDQLHYLGEITDAYGPYGGHASVIRAAAEALAAAFNTDGTYKGATASDPIIVDSVQIFANEADAQAYLAKLLIIYEEQGDGNWVDVTSTTGIPADLFDIVSGYDWTHPGSSLSNPLAFYDGTSIMDGTAFSPESQLLDNNEDGSLKTTPASTNGMTEYTATFFNNQLNGAIIAASFDGKLYFEMPDDTDGDGRTDAVISLGTIENFGSSPLAVTALGDGGFSDSVLIDNNSDGIDDFAGVIIAVTYGSDNITFFVPGGLPVDPGNDLDLDGIDNTNDTHVGDPLDGKGVLIGGNEIAKWDFELSVPGSTPPGAVPPNDSIAGDIGINAAWRNGLLPAVDNGGDEAAGLYNAGVFNLGGASSFVSIDVAHDGTAEGTANTQQDVLGIGFAAKSNTGSVTIVSEMANIFTYSPNTDAPARTWDGGEKVGLFVGPGDQSNFAEATIAVFDDNGTIKYGVQLIVEENDSFVTDFVEIAGIENPVIQGLGDPNFQVAIDVDLTFGAETATARARYVDNGVFTDWVSTATLTLPPDVGDAVQGQFNNLGSTTGAVVGLVSSTTSGDDSFAASWDWVEISGTPGSSEVQYRWNAGTSNVSAIDGGPDWVSDTSFLSGGSTNTATFNIPTVDVSVPNTTPLGIFAQERWDPSSGGEMQLDFDVTAGDYAVRLFMGNGYSGTSDPGERVFDVSIEGQLFLDNLDISAQLGHQVGGMFEWVGTVNDGTIDIDFQRMVENPLINGIEILALNTTPVAPVISVLDDNAGESAGSVGITIQSATIVPLSDTVIVNYAIKPVAGGATPEVDYTVPGATYDPGTGIYTASGSIVGGSADLTFPITILTDNDNEGNEVFEVEITSVSGAGATIGDGTAVVTILDDDSATGGAATLSINENSDNVKISNFGSGSFVISNTGTKVIESVEIDVTDALYPDTVFDPFGIAGDTAFKSLQIDNAGGTGVIAPNNDPNDPTNETYVGTGGIDGYEGIVLAFDQAVNGGFEVGETITFSVDMDPNSVAGAEKTPLDAGSDPNWDVGGVSGAELIGSSFTVTFTDGTTATGQLHGVDNQGGSKGLASQDLPDAQVTLTVNGLSAGGVGTYDASGPSVVISGPAGQTARVVLTKGFIQPVTNEFHNGDPDDQAYAPQLDAQLDALRAEDFPANNAVEFQTVDVVLTGGNQDITNQFDFSQVADFNFAGEGEIPLGFVASVIDTGNGDLPLGPVTDPIYLAFDETAGDTIAPTVQSASSPDIGAAGVGTATTTVTVTFADNDAVDVSSLDVGDITVTGPSGPLAVTGVTINLPGDGSPRTATYTVAAPGGTWDAADDGAYTVALAAGEVLDPTGNAVAADPTLTGFTVDTTAVPPVDPFRVEAEAFDIVSGFFAQSNSQASGGVFLQAGGSGEQRASYVFTEATGTYDLTLGYFDEADGQSQMSILVNGFEVDSFIWNTDAGGIYADSSSFAERDIAGVSLSSGDTIELVGFSDGGEPLRTDYLDFVSAGPAGPDTILPTVQSASSPDIGAAGVGTATTTVTVTFADNDAVDVSTLDVNDISVTGPGGPLAVTGVSVNLPGDGSPRTATYTVAAPGGTWDAADDGAYTVALAAGEVLDPTGNAVAADPTLTGFTVDTTAVPPVDPFRVEAEAFDIVSGFTTNNNPHASAGVFLQSTGGGEHRASYVFTEASGTYDLTLGYFDEADGQSQMSILVNGFEVDSFIWDTDAGGGTANQNSFVEREIAGVSLSSGDTIELVGFADGGEPLRTDYLDFVSTGPAGPDTTLPTVQSASSPDIGAAGVGTATTTVTVTFADNDAVDVSTLDVNDITVTGPGGPLAVTGVTVNLPGDGSPRTATYTVAAPGGTWDVADDGAYTVALAAGEVLDPTGNAVAADPTLTGFTVDTTAVPPVDPFRVEAEAFDIVSGFFAQSNSHASGGEFLQAGGSGEQRASYIFTEATGTYDLTLGYFDEADGQSQMSILINGFEVDSFIWNTDAGGIYADSSSFAEREIAGVSLSSGDTIELVGFSDGGEPLRTDYLDFVHEDALLV